MSSPEVRSAFAKVDALIDAGHTAESPEYQEAWAELERVVVGDRLLDPTSPDNHPCERSPILFPTVKNGGANVEARRGDA